MTEKIDAKTAIKAHTKIEKAIENHRVGKYRLVYEIKDEEIRVHVLEHGKRVYR